MTAADLASAAKDLEAGTVFLADCPARLAIEIIANKWSVVVLFTLTCGPKRRSELVALSGGISRKVLTQTLRRLQSNGPVDRQVYAEAPLRVEYSLNTLGQTLQEPIVMLTGSTASSLRRRRPTPS